MNADLFAREKRFSAAVALAKSLLAKGLITTKEYKEIRQMFIKKYRPSIGGL